LEYLPRYSSWIYFFAGGEELLFRSLEDFDRYIAKEESGYKSCLLCGGVRNKTITNVRMHVEAKHFPGSFVYTCHMCGQRFTNRIALQNHRQKTDCLPPPPPHL
jgi:hypothetical protein